MVDNFRKFTISRDDGFELHLKRKTISFFVYNYLNDGLKAWHENMLSISTKQWHACAHTFQEVRTSAQIPWKEAAKEAFMNILHHYETTKTISRAYSSKREYSVEEAGYHTSWHSQELKLSRVFPAVYFVDTNASEKRTQILSSEKTQWITRS